MRWHDLAFLHWPVRPERLRPHLPAGLALETFDGSAWLGVVPFRMSGVRPRLAPAVAGLSAFPEINLRTYVAADGRPGVWFFSLDVTQRLAVWLARALFHLPYHRARMHCVERAGAIEYSSLRAARDDRVGFEGRYRGVGESFHAKPATLEAFLTERYCLYAADRRGQLFRGDVHHAPWTLQRAECEVRANSLARSLGVDTAGPEPLAHFSRDLEVVAWSLRPVGCRR